MYLHNEVILMKYYHVSSEDDVSTDSQTCSSCICNRLWVCQVIAYTLRIYIYLEHYW